MSEGPGEPTAELAAAVAGLRRLTEDWRQRLVVEKPDFSPSCPLVTVGIPWRDDQTNAAWIGLRLIVWPGQIPVGRRIAVISSRLSRRLDKHPRWFDLLRTAVLRTDSSRELLCTVRGTAAAAATRRAAELLGRSCIEFQVDSGESLGTDSEITRWLDGQAAIHDEFRHIRQAEPDRIAVSPPCIAAGSDLDSAEGAATAERLTSVSGQGRDFRESSESQPVVDRLQFLIADRLMVLQVRAGGHTSRLVHRHLNDPARSDCVVLLADQSTHSKPRSAVVRQADATSNADDARSAVRWLVQPAGKDSRWADSDDPPSVSAGDDSGNDDSRGNSVREGHRQVARSDLLDGPLQAPERWLLHWTRSRQGPWPDQNYHDWLDELILGCPAADRSEMATLLRILSDRRLRSSSDGIRGGVSVVSFTEVALADFRRLRVYRSHRHRYDFEPWGIGIRRQTMVNLGAQPVIYGADAQWESLAADQRWRFQKATRSPGATDNLSEREWRVDGDVDFSPIPESEVCCFVESHAAARVLGLHTSLPIVVVPE